MSGLAQRLPKRQIMMEAVNPETLGLVTAPLTKYQLISKVKLWLISTSSTLYSPLINLSEQY